MINNNSVQRTDITASDVDKKVNGKKVNFDVIMKGISHKSQRCTAAVRVVVIW